VDPTILLLSLYSSDQGGPWRVETPNKTLVGNSEESYSSSSGRGMEEEGEYRISIDGGRAGSGNDARKRKVTPAVSSVMVDYYLYRWRVYYHL
jgi:hypothetical protein